MIRVHNGKTTETINYAIKNFDNDSVVRLPTTDIPDPTNMSKQQSKLSSANSMSSYIQVLEELQSIGRRISQAKQNLDMKNQQRSEYEMHLAQQQQIERERLRKQLEERDSYIQKMHKIRNDLLTETMENAETLELFRISGEPTVSYNDLRQQIQGLRKELKNIDDQLNKSQHYYRFMVKEIFKKSKHSNEYGLVADDYPEMRDYSYAVQDLKALGCLQREIMDQNAIMKAKMKKQMHRLLVSIHEKQQTIKSLSAHIFSRYMHYNIRTPSVASDSRSLWSMRSSKPYSRTTLRSARSGSSKRPDPMLSGLYEIYMGNDRNKTLSRIRSDRKNFLTPQQRLDAIKATYDPHRKQFMLQGIYVGWDGQEIHGIVHSANNLLDNLPQQSFYAQFEGLSAIKVYSDIYIRAIQFIYNHGMVKILGDHTTKADGHQISLSGRILKYLVSYWYAGELAGIKFVYGKDAYTIMDVAVDRPLPKRIQSASHGLRPKSRYGKPSAHSEYFT